MLRTTLIPALLENFKYNFDRGQKDIRFFEISRVFQDIGETLPLEELRLGGLYYSERVPSLWREDVKGFFVAKGALESMFAEFKVLDIAFLPSSESFLEKGQSADIHLAGSYLGCIGVIRHDIIERLDLKKYAPEIVLFEINLDFFFTIISDLIQYIHIPKYPSIERDIAVVVDEAIPASEIQNMIKTFDSELIEKVSVFDIYRGKNIPTGKKSLAFNIVYRSRDRTLRDDDVDLVHTSLIDYILQRTGGALRS